MILVTALLVVVGIVGTLLPIAPGLPIVWGAILLYGLVEGFGTVGWIAMVIVTALAVVGAWLGIRVPQRAAAAGGIPWQGQLLALGLAIVGFFVVPVAGAALGFALGVYLSALLRDRPTSWAVTRATIKALLIAFAIEFTTAVAMGLTWVVWVVI